MTEDMIEMGLRPDDIYMARDSRDKWQDTARPVYTDRPAILRRFTTRWVIGGILLVVMAAGYRFAAPKPGFFLPPRILEIQQERPVKADSAQAVRIICPPPSP